MAEALTVDPRKVAPDTTSADLSDWDSLGHFSIMTLLDKRYNDISLKHPEIVQANSVAELYKFLAKYD